MMDIEEIKAHRKLLEDRLRSAAAKVVDEFECCTSLQVDAVYIDLLRVQAIGIPDKTKVVGVRFEVRL